MAAERVLLDGKVIESLAVVRHLILTLGLLDSTFHVVTHPATVNWRQKNPDAALKLANIATGMQFDEHRLIPVMGRELCELEFADWATPDAPLISLASRITGPDGDVRHLAMMNLHFDEPVTLGHVQKALEQIVDGPFFLMRTDRYYHVYGATLLGEAAWKTWNLKFLMIDAIVSPRYIGHSLQRGFNLLRLNAADRVKTAVPQLVSTQEGEGGGFDFDTARAFALARHARQLTRAGEPYCRHLFEVEAVSRRIAQQLAMADDAVEMIGQTALLHDVIEDTGADYEDVMDVAGRQVADLVAALSNDKRLSKAARDRAFLSQLGAAPLAVHVIKLADLYSNLSSIDRQRRSGAAINRAYPAKAARLLAALDTCLHTTETFRACRQLLDTLDSAA